MNASAAAFCETLAELAERAGAWFWQRPPEPPIVFWEWGYPDLDPTNTNLHGLAGSEAEAVSDAEEALAWLRSRGLITDGRARLLLRRRVLHW